MPSAGSAAERAANATNKAAGNVVHEAQAAGGAKHYTNDPQNPTQVRI